MDASEQPIIRCHNELCRIRIRRPNFTDDELCLPCSKHLQLFGKTRRPHRKNKIVCSNPSCFCSVMPIEIRQHPLTEKWICLSCYEKVSHLESEVKTVAAPPKDVEHTKPENSVDQNSSSLVPENPDTGISYEIYQEALKKYEELRKTMGDLPAI